MHRSVGRCGRIRIGAVAIAVADYLAAVAALEIARACQVHQLLAAAHDGHNPGRKYHSAAPGSTPPVFFSCLVERVPGIGARYSGEEPEQHGLCGWC